MVVDIVGLEISKYGSIDLDIDVDGIYGVETAAPIFCKQIGGSNVEKAAVLCLDSTHKVINFSITAMGDLTNVKPSAAQIVKTALLSNASYILI
jgi:DNA repair protein RadC